MEKTSFGPFLFVYSFLRPVNHCSQLVIILDCFKIKNNMIQSQVCSRILQSSQKVIMKNQKHNCYERIAVEQQSNKSTFPFAIKDVNFPHSIASISSSVLNLQNQWKRAQYFCEKANYSEDVDNLQKPCFSNRAITHVLLLLNWFANDIFLTLFEERKIRPNCLYEYKVLVNGVILKIYLDSYIPVKQGKQIFVQNVQNSIFPCLFEKLLAKIYGNYENISQDPIDLYQTQTLSSKQLIPFYQYNQIQLMDKLQKCQQLGDMIFFRTKNSVGLQTLGFQSNQPFTITRFVKVKNQILCEFLQIDGESWIGKFSKVRAFWANGHPQIQENQLNLQQFGRPNWSNKGVHHPPQYIKISQKLAHYQETFSKALYFVEGYYAESSLPEHKFQQQEMQEFYDLNSIKGQQDNEIKFQGRKRQQFFVGFDLTDVKLKILLEKINHLILLFLHQKKLLTLSKSKPIIPSNRKHFYHMQYLKRQSRLHQVWTKRAQFQQRIVLVHWERDLLCFFQVDNLKAKYISKSTMKSQRDMDYCS